MVRIWFPTEGARRIESWMPGFTRQGRRQSGRRVSRVPGIPRRTSRRWSSSPGVIPGGVSSGIPGGLRHNSREFPTGCCWIPTPQKAAEEVLEAWNHTRRWDMSGPGGLVLYQGGWGRSGPRGGDWIPGNSRLYSSVQIPQNMAMTRSIPTAARGVDTNGLRHLYQGSVGDGKHWITGVQGSYGVINLHFVYTLSLLLQFVYTVT